MERNLLKFNDAKTEFLVIGSNTQLQQITNSTIQIGDEMITASASAPGEGYTLVNTGGHSHTCTCIHIILDQPYECPPLWHSQIFNEQASMDTK